jgi:hypothetical protein
MLCPRGLAPFYRPAIRSVQTAQKLQVVPGAVLGLPLDFTEQLRPTANDLPGRFEWYQSVARKMASAR